MKFLKYFVVAALFAIAFASGYLLNGSRSAAAGVPGERRVLYYVDPMHPAYTSDKPGIAPDCGMALEPVYADEAPAASAPKGKILYYRDPQDPKYTADKAGLNPETGNTLEPVYDEAAPLKPAGTIRVTPERQQTIGLRFALAEMTPGERLVRTVGTVVYDETRVAHVHPRVEGWAEQVLVNFTGEFVKKGQPLLTIYSPELLATQQELLLAKRAKDQLATNPMASAADSGRALFEAARRRLELWNLTPAQVQRVLDTGEPIRSVTLHSPASGYVLARQVFPNQRVTPDSDLYTIVDLSRVWIMADVFESDIPAMRAGSQARITFASGVDPLDARVAYVQPQVDPTTRTLKVRLEANNPGTRLKPDMFVNVELAVAGDAQLTVPVDALIDTGLRQTVFVDLGDGYLEPRHVSVAGRHGGRAVIAAGLRAGERVVASGTFLIDSESQLKAAAAGMGAPKAPDHD